MVDGSGSFEIFLALLELSTQFAHLPLQLRYPRLALGLLVVVPRSPVWPWPRSQPSTHSGTTAIAAAAACL
jgi:hypothetical protein